MADVKPFIPNLGSLSKFVVNEPGRIVPDDEAGIGQSKQTKDYGLLDLDKELPITKKGVPAEATAPVVATPPPVVEATKTADTEAETPQVDDKRKQELLRTVGGTGAGEAKAQGVMQKKLDALPKNYIEEVEVLKNMSADDRDLLLLKGKYAELPNLGAKLADIKTEYNRRSEEMGTQRAWASLFSIVGHVAVGLYGAKHGVDTSGAKFDTYDWAAKYQQIMDNYKISADMAKSEYEAHTSRRQKSIDVIERRLEQRRADIIREGQIGIQVAGARDVGTREAAKMEYDVIARKEATEVEAANKFKLQEANIAARLELQGKTAEANLVALDVKQSHNVALKEMEHGLKKELLKSEQTFKTDQAAKLLEFKKTNVGNLLERQKREQEFKKQMAVESQAHSLKLLELKQSHAAALAEKRAQLPFEILAAKTGIAEGVETRKATRAEMKNVTDLWEKMGTAKQPEAKKDIVDTLAPLIGAESYESWANKKGFLGRTFTLDSTLANEYIDEIRPQFIKYLEEGKAASTPKGTAAPVPIGKTIIRKQVSLDGTKTKVSYSDGTSEII